MSNIVLHPTDISQWYVLVNEAEVRAESILDEAAESYLVFMLMRFSHNQRLLESVVALEFLECMQDESGYYKVERLSEIGDKSLLLSGLFPGIAMRRRVSSDYFSNMGRSAYLYASALCRQRSALFEQLGSEFTRLERVLRALRSSDV